MNEHNYWNEVVKLVDQVERKVDGFADEFNPFGFKQRLIDCFDEKDFTEDGDDLIDPNITFIEGYETEERIALILRCQVIREWASSMLVLKVRAGVPPDVPPCEFVLELCDTVLVPDDMIDGFLVNFFREDFRKTQLN